MAWGNASMGSFIRGTRDVLNEFDPGDSQFAQWLLSQMDQSTRSMILGRSASTDSPANAVNNYFFGGQSHKAGTWKSIGTGNGTALLDTAKRYGWQDQSPVYNVGGQSISQAEMGHRLFSAGWGGENGSVLQNNGASDQDVLTAFTRTTGGNPGTTGGAANGYTPGDPPPGWPPGVPFLVPNAGQPPNPAYLSSQLRATNEAEQRRIIEQQANANYQTRVGEIGQSPRNIVQSAMLNAPQTEQPAPAPPADGQPPYWWPQGVPYPQVPAGQVPSPDQIDMYLQAWHQYELNRIDEQGQNQTRQLSESNLAANPRNGYQSNPQMVQAAISALQADPMVKGLVGLAGPQTGGAFNFVNGRNLPLQPWLVAPDQVQQGGVSMARNPNGSQAQMTSALASFGGTDPTDFWASLETARPRGAVASPTRWA